MDRIDDPGFALAIGDSDGDADDLAARFVQRPELIVSASVFVTKLSISSSDDVIEGMPPIAVMPSAVNFCTTVFIRQWTRGRRSRTRARRSAAFSAVGKLAISRSSPDTRFADPDKHDAWKRKLCLTATVPFLRRYEPDQVQGSGSPPSQHRSMLPSECLTLNEK